MMSNLPSTHKLGEGPGHSTGGIAQFVNLVEKSSEGPSVGTGG